MASAFETFVNTELPKRPSVDFPDGGSFASGIPMIPNGVGLKLVESKNFGFKSAESIYVSLTDPKADYTNINTAIVYAKTIANVSYPIIIYVDKGVYELKDCDISDTDLTENKPIYIIGVNKSPSTYWDYYWGTSTNHFNTTQIVCNVYGNGYGLKTLKAIICFYNCEIKLVNSPDALTTNLSGDGFYMSSGMLIFSDCRILHATSQGTGTGILNFIKGVNGVSAHFYNSSIQNTILGFGGLSYSFINFTAATHPNLFVIGCNIHLKPSTSKTMDFTFYNAATSNYDSNITQTRIENNYIVCSQIQEVAKTITFWKGNHPNPPGRYTVKNNSFDMRITSLRSLPTWIWFDYDTNAVGGNIELLNNSFLNSNNYLPNTYIGKLDTNDTMAFTDNTINGTVIKMLGTGTFTETPIHLGITVPISGNLTAGLPLVPTGTGLTVSPSKNFGYKPKDTIFVSATNPLADYVNLEDALLYAKANAVSWATGVYNINVDAGVYTLSDLDLTLVGIDNVTININGVVSNDLAYTKNSTYTNTVTTISINAYGDNNYGVKLKYTQLIFNDCFIDCINSSSSDQTVSCFTFQNGGIYCNYCRIKHTLNPTAGTGKNYFMNVHSATGVVASFNNCYLFTLLAGGTLNDDYKFINFTSTTHPYLFINNCEILIRSLNAVGNIQFYDAYNNDSSTLGYTQFFNTRVVVDYLVAYNKTVTFWKGRTRGTSSYGNLFEHNSFICALIGTGKIIWFDYDTVSTTSNIKSNFNSFINDTAINNTTIGNIGSGDIIYNYNNIYKGLMTKIAGSGTLQDTSIGITPVVTKTANYTLTNNDYTVFGNHATVPIMFNIPTAIGNSGKEYVIKNIGAANLTVGSLLSETFDGLVSIVLTTNQAITIKSDGTNYFIINRVT